MNHRGAHAAMERCGIVRRGGILLEVVLAVALFGGAAAFTLGCVRSVFATLDRTRRQQEAVDLAQSKLAELEAGLISLAELRGQSQPTGANNHHQALKTEWNFDVKVSRSEFTGLSLVELTVRENTNADNAMSCTLRQLMPLRESKAGDYEPG